MTLNNHFFTIVQKNISDEKAEFNLKLNAEHFIYKAHFPNNPITPGVCMIQIAVELFELLKNTKFRIKTLKNVKFTEIVNPLETPEVTFLLEFTERENLWNVKATIRESETIFAKLSMVLV